MSANYNAEPILRVEQLKQYFKINRKYTLKAVDDVSFEIYPGETYGLVGESGSGKTATLQALVESFSALGLPVFCSDVSGDLGGLCQEGSGSAAELPEALRETYRTRAYPVRFWASGKDAGIPLRVRLHIFEDLVRPLLRKGDRGELHSGTALGIDEFHPDGVAVGVCRQWQQHYCEKAYEFICNHFHTFTKKIPEL